jgi:hypothetical protein
MDLPKGRRNKRRKIHKKKITPQEQELINECDQAAKEFMAKNNLISSLLSSIGS